MFEKDLAYSSTSSLVGTGYQNLDSGSLYHEAEDVSANAGCFSFIKQLFKKSEVKQREDAPQMIEKSAARHTAASPANMLKAPKVPVVTLNNGVKMPMVGFGTYGELLAPFLVS